MTTPNDAARPINGAIFRDGSVSLVPDGSEDSWVARRGAQRVYTAADYDALRAEVEKLQALRKHHRARHKSYKKRFQEAETTNSDLTHEREILRRDIAGWRETHECAVRGIDSLRARAEAAEAKVARCVEAKAAFDKGLRLSDEAGHEVANLWTTKAIRLCAELLGAALNEGGE